MMFWNGGIPDYQTDWSTAANWSTSAVPTSSDDIVFDSSGNGYDCTLTSTSFCKTLTTASSWSKNFNQNGQSLTISGTFSLSHTGTTVLNAITLNANGDFYINSGCGSITYINADLIVQGSGNVTINKAFGATCFRNLNFSSSGKTTTINGTVAIKYTNVLTLQAGGTLLLNNANTFLWAGSGTIIPVITNEATIKSIIYNSLFTFQPSDTSVVSIGSFKCPQNNYNRLTVSLYSAGVATSYNMTGEWNFGYFGIKNNTPNCSMIFNTNDNKFTFFIGNSTSNINKLLSINCGASEIYCFRWRGSFNKYTTYNMGSSKFYVDEQFNLIDAIEFDYGSSKITFNDQEPWLPIYPEVSYDSHIQTYNWPVYDVVVSKSSNLNKLILSDNLACNSIKTLPGPSGGLDSNGFSITADSDALFYSTGIHKLNSIKVGGNFYIDAAVGAWL